MISGDSTASHMGSVKNIEKARERRTFETMPGSSQTGVPDDLLQHAETVHPRMGYDMSDSIFMQEMQAADREKESKKALEERSALEAFRAAAIQKHFERLAPGKSGEKSDSGRGTGGDGSADDVDDKGKREKRGGGPPPPIAGIKIRKKKRQPQKQQQQQQQQKQALDGGASGTKEVSSGGNRDTPRDDRGTKRSIVPGDGDGAAGDRERGGSEEEGSREGTSRSKNKKPAGGSKSGVGGKPSSSSGGQTAAGGVGAFVASAAKGDGSVHPAAVVGKPDEAGSGDGPRDAAAAAGVGGLGLVAYSSGDDEDDDDSDSKDA